MHAANIAQQKLSAWTVKYLTIVLEETNVPSLKKNENFKRDLDVCHCK